MATVLAEHAHKPRNPGKTWQQTKSHLTRKAILAPGVHCFFALGYSNTATENIAAAAGVSRGRWTVRPCQTK